MHGGGRQKAKGKNGSLGAVKRSRNEGKGENKSQEETPKDEINI